MATSMPSRPEMMPRSSEPSLTEAMRTIAISTRLKISNGPNFVASSDSGRDRATRKIQARQPPKKEALIPKPSARAGWPPRAMG